MSETATKHNTLAYGINIPFFLKIIIALGVDLLDVVTIVLGDTVYDVALQLPAAIILAGRYGIVSAAEIPLIGPLAPVDAAIPIVTISVIWAEFSNPNSKWCKTNKTCSNYQKRRMN